MSYQYKIKIEIIHIVAIKFVSFKNNKIINDLDFKGLCFSCLFKESYFDFTPIKKTFSLYFFLFELSDF